MYLMPSPKNTTTCAKPTDRPFPPPSLVPKITKTSLRSLVKKNLQPVSSKNATSLEVGLLAPPLSRKYSSAVYTSRGGLTNSDDGKQPLLCKDAEEEGKKKKNIECVFGPELVFFDTWCVAIHIYLRGRAAASKDVRCWKKRLVFLHASALERVSVFSLLCLYIYITQKYIYIYLTLAVDISCNWPSCHSIPIYHTHPLYPQEQSV